MAQDSPPLRLRGNAAITFLRKSNKTLVLIRENKNKFLFRFTPLVLKDRLELAGHYLG